jgi:cytochrome d ubiquinol oxidase subunit II
MMHGAVYLQWRTTDVIAQRARKAVQWSGSIFALSFVLAGIWIATGIEGFEISSVILTTGPTDPLTKTVIHATGLWLENYRALPALWLLPAMSLAGVALARLGSQQQRAPMAFLGSTAAVLAAVTTAAAAMFPFIMPSCTVPNHSLTAWDASASLHTLRLLTLITLVMLPVVLTYTLWAYRVIWGQITESAIEADTHSLY